MSFPPMTDKAAEAFSDYVDLEPGKRSLRALAEIYVQQKRYRTATTAVGQLGRWSSQYQWPARIAEAVTVRVTRKLEEAAELDADTFNKTSKRLNDLVSSPGHIHPGDVTRIRESVRKPEPKPTATIDVKHSGTVKHAHHDMSQFTDDEIETLAAIAERQLAEVAE